MLTPKHLSLPRLSALGTCAFLCLPFALPWSDGNFQQIITWCLMLLAFNCAVAWFYRKEVISLFGWLKKNHAAAYYLFWAWFTATQISMLSVLVSDVPLIHKLMSSYRHSNVLFYTFSIVMIARFSIISGLSHLKIFLALMAGLMALLCLYLLTYHFDPAPDESIWARFPPMGTHVRNIGNIGATVCVTALVMFLNQTAKHRWMDILIVCGLFAAWTFLVWNGGRSSVAAALITSVIISIYSVVYANASAKRLLAFLVLLVAATLLADNMSVFSWNGLQRTSNIIAASNTASNSGTEALTSDQFTAGRTTIWTMSMNAFKTAPWFGLGPYGYFFIPERTDDDQPHNLIIQFLLEWGMVGTSFLLALMAYCAWHGLRQLPAAFRERDFGYVCGAAVVLLLTMDGLTAGTYFKFQPMICVCIAYAIFPFGRRNTISPSLPATT